MARRNHSSMYMRWQNMKSRCYNQNVPGFKDYGARGITVCERWKNSFDAFAADMGSPPSGTSLDRINNDGPYSPENCRWASRLTQTLNRSITTLVTYNGKTQTIPEWAAEVGLKPKTLAKRIYLGWTAADALSTRLWVNGKVRKMEMDKRERGLVR